MGGQRESNLRERKHRILDAAAKLIASEGAEACTMRRLARAAQLDVVTLYNHYGSKEEILEALRRSGARSLHRRFERLTETEPLDLIRAIVKVSLLEGAAPIDVARPKLLPSSTSRRLHEGPFLAAVKERGSRNNGTETHTKGALPRVRYRCWVPVDFLSDDQAAA